MKKNRTLKEHISMIVRGYKIVWRVYHRHLSWKVLDCICKLISPYFTLYMSSLVVNELVYSRDLKRLLSLAAITVGGLFLISILNRLLQGRVKVYGSMTWREDMFFYLKEQNRMQYDHLENPDVTILREKIFAAKNATGGGLQKLLWNVENLIEGIGNVIFSSALTISLFTSSASGTFSGLLGFLNSPLAVAVIVGCIAANAAVAIKTTNAETRKVTKAWQDLAADNSRYFALKQIRGNDAYIFDMHRIVLRESRKHIRPSYVVLGAQYQMKYGTVRMAGDYLMTLVLFIYVAGKAYSGAFGIGSFLLYRGTVAKFIDGVSTIANAVGQLVQNNVDLERLFGFLDLPDDMYHGTLSVEKRDDIDYEIEFCDVSFKYPRSDTWALRHVSMKFKVGDCMAVVGMNGSGKTTFIKLLCRLYDPTEGQILLNGIDITRYKYDEYMNIFSVVFQDYKLFSFSIAENVAATLDYDREKVQDCLERVGIGKRVGELERGIETPLGRDYEDDGIEISGGEAQKLAIARALYKDAPFIVLDEPTAALDPMVEAEIYSHLNQIVTNKTAIYISHRLSSCRFCNHILVFDQGSIVQQGSHEELVAQAGGKYQELWNAQAQYYVSE